MEPNATKKRGKRLNFKNNIESNKNEYSENGRRKEVEITESDYMVTSSYGPQMKGKIVNAPILLFPDRTIF